MTLLRFHMSHRCRFIGLAMLLALVSSLVLTACGVAPGNQNVAMASHSDMPAQVQAAPANVRQAYRFATANPELLKQIPCYCGCSAMGHTSNYACYVAEVDPAGATRFDLHALACGICVDITQDAMRMLKQGRSAAEIRSYVDATYSKFGPSTTQ